MKKLMFKISQYIVWLRANIFTICDIIFSIIVISIFIFLVFVDIHERDKMDKATKYKISIGSTDYKCKSYTLTQKELVMIFWDGNIIIIHNPANIYIEKQ